MVIAFFLAMFIIQSLYNMYCVLHILRIIFCSSTEVDKLKE